MSGWAVQRPKWAGGVRVRVRASLIPDQRVPGAACLCGLRLSSDLRRLRLGLGLGLSFLSVDHPIQTLHFNISQQLNTFPCYISHIDTTHNPFFFRKSRHQSHSLRILHLPFLVVVSHPTSSNPRDCLSARDLVGYPSRHHDSQYSGKAPRHYPSVLVEFFYIWIKSILLNHSVGRCSGAGVAILRKSQETSRPIATTIAVSESGEQTATFAISYAPPTASRWQSQNLSRHDIDCDFPRVPARPPARPTTIYLTLLFAEC